MLKELIMKLFPKMETKYILAKRKSDDKYLRFKVQSRNQIYLNWFGTLSPSRCKKMVPLYAKRKELEDIIDHIPGGNGLKTMDARQKEWV